MPGPCNQKKMRRIQARKAKARTASQATNSNDTTPENSPPRKHAPGSAPKATPSQALRASIAPVNANTLVRLTEDTDDGWDAGASDIGLGKIIKRGLGKREQFGLGEGARPLPQVPQSTFSGKSSTLRSPKRAATRSRTLELALGMVDDEVKPLLPPVEQLLPEMAQNFSFEAPPTLPMSTLSLSSPTSSDTDSHITLSHTPPFHTPPSHKLAPLLPQPPFQPSQIPMPRSPIIHDPGSGPRVTDMPAFLQSPFAAPPAPSCPELDVPPSLSSHQSASSLSLSDAQVTELCALLASPEMTQILLSLLPLEAALTLQYNRSRISSRVCPACMRLYRVGEPLKALFNSATGSPLKQANPLDEESWERREWVIPNDRERREQFLSGICSSMCFTVASYNYLPLASALYGRTEAELDDASWEVLSGPGMGLTPASDKGLGLLVRMSRMEDLGLEALLGSS